jgi:hypothetical protein
MTDDQVAHKHKIQDDLRGNRGWEELSILLQSWRDKRTKALQTSRFLDMREVDALQAEIALIDRVLDYGGE